MAAPGGAWGRGGSRTGHEIFRAAAAAHAHTAAGASAPAGERGAAVGARARSRGDCRARGSRAGRARTAAAAAEPAARGLPPASASAPAPSPPPPQALGTMAASATPGGAEAAAPPVAPSGARRPEADAAAKLFVGQVSQPCHRVKIGSGQNPGPARAALRASRARVQIPKTLEEGPLRDMMAMDGDVLDVVIMRDRLTRAHKGAGTAPPRPPRARGDVAPRCARAGCAFVIFRTRAQAEAAIRRHNNRTRLEPVRARAAAGGWGHAVSELCLPPQLPNPMQVSFAANAAQRTGAGERKRRARAHGARDAPPCSGLEADADESAHGDV